MQKAHAMSPEKKSLNPIIIIGCLFFIFGFITWLNSVLIPYLKIACELTTFESYFVATAFYISYFVMAIPSSWVLKRTGFKNGMSTGLIVIGVGALIFIPAALTRIYELFLLGLFVQGTGLALLQTATNPYVTILGPIESAAKRISIMGICNKVAGAIAPIILGAITLKDADEFQLRIKTMTEVDKSLALDELASRVIVPYVLIIVVLLVLAGLIYKSNLPSVKEENAAEEQTQTDHGAKRSIMQFPHLLLGVFTLFLYVGAEVLAGDSIIPYGTAQGIALSTAKFFTTATLLAMIVGYVIGIFCIPKYLSQEKALTYSGILGILFTLGAIFTQGYTSVLCIALLGLANSLVWPAIWPLAIDGLGKFTKIGSSLLIMAIAGGAIIPLVYGKLADVFNAQQAYWLLVPCYLFIVFYAIKGHKYRS